MRGTYADSDRLSTKLRNYHSGSCRHKAEQELVTFNQRQRWLRKLRKIWFVDSSLRPELIEALLKARDGELIKVEDVRTLTHNVRMLKRG